MFPKEFFHKVFYKENVMQLAENTFLMLLYRVTF